MLRLASEDWKERKVCEDNGLDRPFNYQHACDRYEDLPWLFTSIFEGRTSDIQKRQNNLEQITMFTHTGSHLDAPGHLIEGGLMIDQIPPDRWIRKGVTLDFRQTPEFGVITIDDLNRAEADIKGAGIAIEKGDIVLLCTGHHERTWGSFDYWDRTPRVDPAAAEWFIEREVSGAGYDFFQEGADLPPKGIPLGETARFHMGLLSQGIFNIEYLQNLHMILGKKVLIIAAPLLIRGGEGAPARVVAIEGSF